VKKRTDQAASLRALTDGNVHSIERPRRRVVAVTGGKGGIGKSTLALNLALAWAKRGARTLAVDGDAGMADLNLLLGVAPERSMADILEGTPAEDVLVEAHGVHLLPALNGSQRLANLDQDLRRRLFHEIGRLSNEFDTVVIDTPAGIASGAMALAGAAADVIVVANSEPLSLADAYACLKVLSRQEGVRSAYVLPNEIRSPSEADEVFGRLSALVDRFLDMELAPLPAVPWDPAVSQAAVRGVPLMIDAPDSPASRALRQAARRLDAFAIAAPPKGALANFMQGAG
jgi:flagellar biosynthesis protein FlhG